MTAPADDGAPAAGAGRIIAVDIESDASFSHDLEQERRVAVFELCESAALTVLSDAGPALSGPFRLVVDTRAAADWRIVATGADGAVAAPLEAARFSMLLGEYVALCAAYRDAVRELSPSEIEALDAERRAQHAEAAEQVRQALAPRLVVDAATARNLVTLLCAAAGDALEGGL